MSNTARLKQLLNRIRQANRLHLYKIRAKKLKHGGYSLYLDRRSGGRKEYITLNLYLSENDIQGNKVNVSKAIAYRDRLESDSVDKDLGLTTRWKKRSSFIEYALTIAQQKDQRWKSAVREISAFANGSLTFSAIDNKWVADFRDYLLKKHTQNTAWAYFGVYKALINRAYKEEIIDRIPGYGESIRLVRHERVFLTLDELKAIARVDIYPDVRDAFIFGCYTGLRISDIEQLTWDSVADGYLSIMQKKTREQVRNKLPATAQGILDRQDRSRKYVFNLPSRTVLQTRLQKIIEQTDIKKHITFHASRHTFAIWQLMAEVSLYTVSKLLGHNDIATTQQYARIVDSMKDDAIDKFSEKWEMDLS
jgi:integrase